MTHRLSVSRWLLAPLLLIFLGVVACATGSQVEGAPVLKISGIPDQDTARLARRFQQFADYMSEELGVPVEYVPSVSYAAVVTAFSQGDLQLAFFGGFTGVQARLQNPGARAIAQRETDARFHSKFIARADLPLESLEDLKEHASDLTITFGSESSTSGHLMPRHFMTQAGINPETDFQSEPNFSGSHDLTWQLVEGGSFDVGVLSEEVWDRAVQEGRVDTSNVREFYLTPAYLDYNWTARPDLDQLYGDGFTDEVKAALLKLNMEEHGEILELFATEKFIETDNDNYADLEQVARSLGMIQ
jgi:phosphonate transport system substrate-binding protein